MISKVCRWVGHLDEAASIQPQLAYAVLSRSLQHEWTFLLRVVPQCGQLFQVTLFSFLTSHVWVFALPLRLGDLGICNPVSLASHLFDSSIRGTEHLVRSIEIIELDSHFDRVSSNKLHHCHQLNTVFDEEFGRLLALFDPM